MDFRRLLVTIAPALLVLSGCRHNHAARELLERELRWQEDRIYELEAKLQDAERDLDRFRDRSPSIDSNRIDRLPPSSSFDAKFDTRAKELNSGSSRIDSHTLDSSTPRTAAPSSTDANKAPPFQGPPTISPPSVEIPEGLPSNRAAPATPSTPGRSTTTPESPSALPAKDPSSLVPSVTLPEANAPSTTLPQSPSSIVPSSPTSREPPTIPPPKNVPPPFKTMSSPKFVPPSARPRLLNDDDQAGTSSRRTSPSAAEPSLPKIESSRSANQDDGDSRVVEISLSLASCGIDLDGKPGDDGIRVVLEPRNQRGRIVSATGAAAIVLIDPAEPGEAGRFARWDFQPDDTVGLFRPANDRDGAGIYFDLPWPETPPAHSRLRLFVRLTTSDGRTLQADRELLIRRGGEGEQVRREAFAPAVEKSPVVRAGGGSESPTIADTAPAGNLSWGAPTKATPSASMPTPAPSPPPKSVPTSAGPNLFPAYR